MGAKDEKRSARARSLRANQTDAERRIWARLRDRRLFGFKFVRQEQIGPFFADFACREANLVIELDGGHHADDMAYDGRRTEILEEHGYRVIRFWNSDALRNTDAVLQVIADQLSSVGANRFEGREPRQ